MYHFYVIDLLAAGLMTTKMGVFGNKLATTKKPHGLSVLAYPVHGPRADECEFILGLSSGFLGLIKPGSREVGETIKVSDGGITAMCLMAVGKDTSLQPPVTRFNKASGTYEPVYEPRRNGCTDCNRSTTI